jgi:hypothetical protein
MYLVVFREMTLHSKFDFVNNLYYALTGGYSHCEIVFENNGFFDALVLTTKTPDGYPVFVANRQYSSHAGKYKHCFFKFTNLSHVQESMLKEACKRIANEKKYQLSLNMMLSTVLPEWLLSFRDTAVKSIGGPANFKEALFVDTKPSYCVEIIREVFEGILPTDWPNNLTSLDLVLFFLKKQRITIDLNDETRMRKASKKTSSLVEIDDDKTMEEKTKKKVTIRDRFQRSFDFSGEETAEDWV